MKAKFHFLREKVNKEALKVIHCSTEMQLVEMFTNAVKIERFNKLRGLIGQVKLENFN
jgi:hypothetical protein